MIFAIIYAIDDSKRDYSRLYEKIKSFGVWMHYIDSAWFVSVSGRSTAKDISNELRPLIDKDDDYLLVIQVTRNYHGWLPEDAWKWMKERTY